MNFKGEMAEMAFSLINSHFRTFSFEGVAAQIQQNSGDDPIMGPMGPKKRA
jgi:hypothetical protein